MQPKQLFDILMQGKEAWNRWRKEHPDLRPDLGAMDFQYFMWNDMSLDDTILNEIELSEKEKNI